MKTVEKVVVATGVLCIPLFVFMAHDMRVYLAQRRVYAPADNVATMHWQDPLYGIVIAVILTQLRKLFFSFIAPLFHPLMINKPHHSTAMTLSRRDRLASNIFGCAFYTFSTLVGWWVLLNKDWAPWQLVPFAKGDPDNMWSHYWTYRTPLDVRLYYALGLGHSLHAFHLQLFYKERRRDFFEMMVHHVTAVLLIALSYVYGYTRVGTLVLLLHDASDVPISLTRCMGELVSTKATAVFFLWLTVSWLYCRLVCFPFIVIHSTTFRAVPLVNAQGFEARNAGYYPFNILLWILLVLHVFWFYMFLKMWWVAIFQKKLEDSVHPNPNPNPDQHPHTPQPPPPISPAGNPDPTMQLMHSSS
jgi:hypothetical protein